MSASFKLQYRDSRGQCWFIRCVPRGQPDVAGMFALRGDASDSFRFESEAARATSFISEAEAWVCAAKFKLAPERVKVVP